MNLPFPTHLNEQGEAHMVDVGMKVLSERTAVARCEIRMKKEILEFLYRGDLEKGDALTVAQVAGILAAKKTSDLIPLCHPLPIDHADIRFKEGRSFSGLEIEAEVRTNARTGVEMEALTAAAVAALTVYDMVKACDPSITMTDLRLIKKTGGKSSL